MTRGNYSLLIGVMLLAILLTNFGLFIAPAISSESVEQKRTDCIQECQLRFLPADNSTYLMYYRCMDNCENKFWNEWDKKMDNLEKD